MRRVAGGEWRVDGGVLKLGRRETRLRSVQLTTKFTKQLSGIVHDEVHGIVEAPPCSVNFAVN
jgi:hypothetical protein